MARYGSEFLGSRRDWDRDIGRGYGGEYGYRGGPGRRNRYGTFEPSWREAAYRGGFRGRGEERGRGMYGTDFYGRPTTGGRGFGGGAGRGAYPGERGWGRPAGYEGAGRYGYGTSRGFVGPRRRPGYGATGWGYGGEYRSMRERAGYGQDFGDRLERGWTHLKRGMRGVFGGHDYDREYRRRV